MEIRVVYVSRCVDAYEARSSPETPHPQWGDRGGGKVAGGVVSRCW